MIPRRFLIKMEHIKTVGVAHRLKQLGLTILLARMNIDFGLLLAIPTDLMVAFNIFKGKIGLVFCFANPHLDWQSTRTE